MGVQRRQPGAGGRSQATPRAVAPKSKGAGIAASPLLRRDVDLPVFVSLATRRSPAPRSWRTSSGFRFPPRWFRKEPHFPSAPRSEDPFASGPLRVRPKTSRALAFIGPSWAGPLSRGLTSWGSPPSRQPGPTLPAPLTGWSESPRWWVVASSLARSSSASSPRGFHRLPAEIGLSVLSSPRVAVAGSPGRGGDFRPDHNWTVTRHSESRKAESAARSLWITGILAISRESRGGSRPLQTSRAPQ